MRVRVREITLTVMPTANAMRTKHLAAARLAKGTLSLRRGAYIQISVRNIEIRLYVLVCACACVCVRANE